MLRKWVAYVMCICLIMPLLFKGTVKAEGYQHKYLSVKRENDGLEAVYEVVTDGRNVYLNVEDLIELARFEDYVVDKTEENIEVVTLIKKKFYKFDQSIQIYPKENKISSDLYGESKFEGCLDFEEDIYLDIIEIFNYLRIKIEVINEQMLINIPVYTILDFMLEDYPDVFEKLRITVGFAETGRKPKIF